jgi:DNA relaxase NicK
VNRTHIDAHAFRWRISGDVGTFGPLQSALRGVFAGHRDEPTLVPRKGGMLGYSASADIRLGEMDVGVLAWGGANQRGWGYAGFMGRGCEWIRDWDRALEAIESLPSYEAKRTDIALDVFDTVRHGIFDETLAAYRAGGFSPAGAGRPPKCLPLKPERPEDSAIIRIADRASAKYYRGYEKGIQLFGADALPSADGKPALMLPMVLNGETVEVEAWKKWRHELELKPVNGPLPADLIERRDEYFAGSYPYLGQVLQGVEPQILVMRRERGPQLDLEAAIGNVRKQWGPTLFTALVAYEGDISAVWSKIVGTKHNEKLLRAGVLQVAHE